MLLQKIWHAPRDAAAFCIRLYQKTISPDHGLLQRFFPHGYCKFAPSCSEYARQAFEKYGFIKGFFKATWRIIRCNPWSTGGLDCIE
ncbi:MAG: membrane protein insertion efficiency factor YidD [Patescibacteria group bacterium]